MATQRLRWKLERDGAPERVNLGESFVTYVDNLTQYGTPLPALNEHGKDKNEYKPVWQQEAYDEKGRRRFHGAFTGGFSAGYFNTVGSKEGWTPSSFKSSRKSRAGASAQRPEDFMDDEDLAELNSASKLITTDAYAQHEKASDPFMNILQPSAEGNVQASSSHMGQALLRRMGWKPGQGIGPLVSHTRREQLRTLLRGLHLAPARDAEEDHSEAARHKFPPPDTQLVQLPDNREKRGLGSAKGASALQDALQRFHHEKETQRTVGMSGMDSDDEDHVYSAPQDIRDSTLGRGDTLRIGEQPPKAEESPALAQEQWHDGRPLVKGFVLGKPIDAPKVWFHAPSVPKDWQPDPRRVWAQSEKREAEAPKHAADRGRILGEAKLPGPPPAIAAYLGEKAAQRMQAATLPPAPPKPLHVPALDAETAVRALENFVPVGSDTEKHERYKAYLQAYANHTTYTPPDGVVQDELDEFFETAERHRPVRGAMASRFTSSTLLQPDTPGTGGLMGTEEARAQAPAPVAAAQLPRTPAQEAARAGDFGDRTRTVMRYVPPKLLCKRLGVAPPYTEPEQDDTQRVLDKFGAAPEPTPEADAEPEFVFVPHSEAAEQAAEEEYQEARPSLDLFKAVFESDDDDDEPTAPRKRKTDASKPKKKAKDRRVGPLTFDLDDDEAGGAPPVPLQRRDAPPIARPRASDLFE